MDGIVQTTTRNANVIDCKANKGTIKFVFCVVHLKTFYLVETILEYNIVMFGLS